MVDVVFNGVQVLHRINKDEGDESMPLLPFRKDVVNTIFLKYWADHSPAIPSDVCYDDTKYSRCNLNTDVFRTSSSI